MTTVAVCVPTIPARGELLRRAVASVNAQRVREDVSVVISVALDDTGAGAAATRNRAWRDVGDDVDWVAFLDDDDELGPDHVQLCLDRALEADADLVYPWFRILNATGGDITAASDPLRAPVGGRYASPYGVPFGDDLRRELMTRNNFIPVTVLVRRKLLAAVGGFPLPNTSEWPESCCEDWGLWRRLLEAGARFEHLPRRTWNWRWHGANTSGKPWKR